MNKFILLLILILNIIVSVSAEGKLWATYYSDYYEGKLTASGKIFSQESNIVATRNIYKFGTNLLICHNDRCVRGIVADRCQCDLDLSKSLFEELAPLELGRIKVRVKVID